MPRNRFPGITAALAAGWLTACAPIIRTPDVPVPTHGQPIDLVYIHGAGWHNETHRDRFIGQIDTLHGYVLREFAATPAVREDLYEDGRYHLNPEPVAYYWGDIIEQEIEALDRQLAWAQISQTNLVARLQRRIAYAMHDTFWVSKLHNKQLLLGPLHELIRARVERGHKAVIWGQSAGAIVALDYMLYHVRYLELEQVLSKARVKPDALRAMVQNSSIEKTCAQALFDAGLIQIDHRGRLGSRLYDLRLNDEELRGTFEHHYYRERLTDLERHTETTCAPKDSLRGLITAGSPAALFMATGLDAESYMFRFFLKHMYEQDMFWLNINHHDDLVGLPIYDDRDLVAQLEERLGIPIRPDRGFFVSKSDVKRGATILAAHSWYLHKPAHFARVMAEAYAQGYARIQSDADAQSGAQGSQNSSIRSDM